MSRPPEKCSMYGKKHSETTKEKIRLKAIGRKHTETTRRKISLIQIGKMASLETKKKNVYCSHWKEAH